MESQARLRVMITAKEAWDEKPYTQVWDMKERLLDLILGFGNGVWMEIRVIAETQDGLDAMRGLLSKGGYTADRLPDPKTTLFQEGDECWAGFVFLDLNLKPLP